MAPRPSTVDRLGPATGKVAKVGSVERDQNENEEKKERKRILYEGQYYDVTDWIQRHPGGSIIKFYTEGNEDATMAIQQFHYRSKEKVMKIMKQFRVKGEEGERGKDPVTSTSTLMERSVVEEDLTSDRNARLTEDLTKLHKELEAEGYFKPSIPHLIFRWVDILGLGFLGFWILGLAPSYSGVSFVIAKIVGAFFMSLCFGRCGFLGHEACHISVAGNKTADGIIAKLSYGLGLGLSPSWWSSQHSRHHAMPQRLHRDVDLMTLPLLAFNSKILDADKNNNYEGGSKKNFFILNQSILFVTVDTVLVVLFWKFYLNPRYALKKGKWAELFFMALHHLLQYSLLNYYGFGMYAFGFWMSAIYMFGNFTLSHSHLPVTERPLHWLEYGLMHTQDVDSQWCPWLCDWWMGWLSCQVEHHLFPTMPHFRTRFVKDRVKALAEKHGIPYQSQSYGQAVLTTYRNLRDIANHLKTT